MSARQKVVRVADLQVGGAGDVLMTVGLGSCVAIVLYDRGRAVGGMAHVLLPSPGAQPAPTATRPSSPRRRCRACSS